MWILHTRIHTEPLKWINASNMISDKKKYPSYLKENSTEQLKELYSGEPRWELSINNSFK